MRNVPEVFITDKNSLLPYETQKSLLKQKDAINDNESIMALALKRLSDEPDSFARLPSKMLQKCGKLLVGIKGAAGLYFWLMGYANWDDRPGQTYLGLDQWLRAGFIVTSRKEPSIATELGVDKRTIFRYLNALEKIGFIQRVGPYKSGLAKTLNVILLGYTVGIGDQKTSVWLPEINCSEEIYGYEDDF